MAKYKYSRVSLARKKELDSPDEFLTYSQQALAFVLKHQLKAAIGLGVFFALAILFLGGRYYFQVQEKNAFSLREAVIRSTNDLGSTMDPEEVYESVADDFQSILDKYPGTMAGKLARINFANICFAAGKYDDAIDLYKKGVADFNDNPGFRNLVLSSLGHSYEAKKDNASAVIYFEMIVSGQANMLKDEALFSLGRIYRELGDPAKSNAAYQRIISDHADSMYVDMAKESITG